ncbi:NAD-dependent protein deacetylase [Actinomadura graeca]|uniref:NAD-dependent protein deacetylase n=1 Tax=Actinomadura graeca TaxID=2750812 RepID=A0ABX8QQ40_9ACTN|nr:NAD-dependent protein deacetylase [Actinomadura graeca]QXJ19867.1 NAD-dependent protein deacetylase [Actinomadura graeca]
MTQVADGPAGAAGRAEAAAEPGLRVLADLVADGDVIVLSGAGLSTESGIPDYRGETGRRRRAEPMTFQRFTGSPAARRRYWARSHLGWRHIAGARPNAGHRAVAELQRRGLVGGVITQNVDGLHQAAGARDVVELHGGLDRVVCLACGDRTPRGLLHRRLRDANPGWEGRAETVNPDGDAVLDDAAAEAFRTVDCDRCGGLLKPDVVFFGENVPPARVRECYGLTGGAGTLLVLGSSLTVLSGYRFVRHAAGLGIPVAIVNRGATRGDAHALVTLDAPLGRALTGLLAELGPAVPAERADRPPPSPLR